MTCPYCGSPDIELIGSGLYVCLDCGEQFSTYGKFQRRIRGDEKELFKPYRALSYSL